MAKTYRNLYPRVYSFENLYRAWRQARKGKRGRSEVASFEHNLESNLLRLQEELTEGCESRAGLTVARGGSWNNNETSARAAYRDDNQPTNGNNNNGFRLAVAPLTPLRIPPEMPSAAVRRRPRSGEVAGPGPGRRINAIRGANTEEARAFWQPPGEGRRGPTVGGGSYRNATLRERVGNVILLPVAAYGRLRRVVGTWDGAWAKDGRQA